jgi:hypothetical protein
MNPTPETDAMASMQRTHQEWRAHSETLERDRDEWKEEAELREKKSDVWEHEAEILREELKKADDVLERNIETFLDLREERDNARNALNADAICDWEQMKDGQWLSDCNNVVEFMDGSPIYNGFIRCPYCRKNLTETPYLEDGESDHIP